MQHGAALELSPVIYLGNGWMRRALRIIALCTVVISLAGWLALGAHRGWTKTTVPHNQVDSVTGLEYPVIENRFVPGIELLALSWIIAGVLFGGSLIRLPRKQQTTNHEI